MISFKELYCVPKELYDNIINILSEEDKNKLNTFNDDRDLREHNLQENKKDVLQENNFANLQENNDILEENNITLGENNIKSQENNIKSQENNIKSQENNIRSQENNIKLEENKIKMESEKHEVPENVIEKIVNRILTIKEEKNIDNNEESPKKKIKKDDKKDDDFEKFQSEVLNDDNETDFKYQQFEKFLKKNCSSEISELILKLFHNGELLEDMETDEIESKEKPGQKPVLEKKKTKKVNFYNLEI